MSIEPSRRHLEEEGSLCWLEEPICGLRLLVRRRGRCVGSNEPGKEVYPERLNVSKDGRNGVQRNGGDQLRMVQQLAETRGHIERRLDSDVEGRGGLLEPPKSARGSEVAPL